MKTKWGSCGKTGILRINLELAKKPPQCLEYIVVHELVHLIEPTHNKKFEALMNKYMPRWKDYRNALQQLPLKEEKW
jgi:predicted metal-dependent hydrolase